MYKFDRPYRLLPTHDQKKVVELFNIVETLDTSELLQYSLTNQIPLDVIYDDNGNTLIHSVIKMDNRKTNELSKLNIIKFLFQNGCNPDTPNKMNQTPLHLACQCQLKLIVKYLLDINVNPNYTDNLGLYPFHYLFFGEIKVLTNSRVLNFVDPPKESKTDFTEKEEIIKIKGDLFKLIKDEPVFNTMRETINDLVINDPDNTGTIDKFFELFNSIKDDPQKITDSTKLELEKENQQVKYFRLKKKFNNFKTLDEIKIHKPYGLAVDSWRPPSIINGDHYLIYDHDYKKKIKEEIRNNILQIIEENNRYIPQNDGDQGGGGPIENNDKLHNCAVDYASSIIDFENNIYLGGSREIYISEIVNDDDYGNFNNTPYIIATLDETSKYINNCLFYDFIIKKLTDMEMATTQRQNITLYKRQSFDVQQCAFELYKNYDKHVQENFKNKLIKYDLSNFNNNNNNLIEKILDMLDYTGDTKIFYLLFGINEALSNIFIYNLTNGNYNVEQCIEKMFSLFGSEINLYEKHDEDLLNLFTTQNFNDLKFDTNHHVDVLKEINNEENFRYEDINAISNIFNKSFIIFNYELYCD